MKSGAKRFDYPTLVVSNLQPAPRPIPRSRNWFQIRHHQGKSRANGYHCFTWFFAAILCLKRAHTTTLTARRCSVIAQRGAGTAEIGAPFSLAMNRPAPKIPSR